MAPVCHGRPAPAQESAQRLPVGGAHVVVHEHIRAGVQSIKQKASAPRNLERIPIPAECWSGSQKAIMEKTDVCPKL
ncbi:hypothetical protein RRG08_002517 [Elysia crispata]|uniref:Uncharacterized protein n=1 Tax=Elysia crispata TaxID=231223 RepID=A0AAE1A7T0_9GAST|nr:hypothetical protein RRG08_002517 [Elysia crispata]